MKSADWLKSDRLRSLFLSPNRFVLRTSLMSSTSRRVTAGHVELQDSIEWSMGNSILLCSMHAAEAGKSAVHTYARSVRLPSLVIKMNAQARISIT